MWTFLIASKAHFSLFYTYIYQGLNYRYIKHVYQVSIYLKDIHHK